MEWPDGTMKLILKLLNRKFQSMDIISKAKMCMDLLKMKMKLMDNPVTLFTQINNIENQYKKQLDTDEMLAKILMVCSDCYKTTITAEQ